MRIPALLCVVLMLLSGCGFQPVYGTVGDRDIEVATYLSSIRLKQKSGVMGQQLQNQLEDLFSPDSADSLYGESFQLEFDVDSKRDAVVIEQDGSISRFNILLTSHYKLIDEETGEVLDKGTVRRTASFYNAPEKFSAYIAEKDAMVRALREMAEDYKMRMAAYFAREYKLGQRG